MTLTGRLIDVDTHFIPRIDRSELRDLLPRATQAQAFDMLEREAQRTADPRAVRAEMMGDPVKEEKYGDPHRDPEARVETMKTFGFDTQVLIPDGLFGGLHGGGPYTVPAPLEVRLALCRLFNNATAAAQTKFPESFIGTSIVPFDNIEVANEELRRAAGDLGLQVVVIPFNWMGKNFDEFDLYPFWETVEGLGMTVFVHGITQGCGGNGGDHQPKYHAAFAERMRRLHLGTYMGFGLEYTMATGSLTLGGVLDEFPGLRFCFFEAGASWLPYAMYACDRSFLIERQCSRTANLPSELILQHCLTAIEPMESMKELIEIVGNENFFFGTDFPHAEFRTFHGSNRSVSTHAAGAAAIVEREGLTDADRANLLGGNIARVLSR